MRVFSVTDCGMVRKSNQDAYAHGSFDEHSVWAVVCDGMGGANGGEIASNTAVEKMRGILSASSVGGLSGNSIRNILSSAIAAANIAVFDKSRESESLSGMGSTVVAAIVRDRSVYIAYAGDSRAYVIGKNGISQITVDHSVVQAMIDRGQITEDEARSHPRRNLITRALGVNEVLDIDYCECQLEEGDIVLICTDGLSNFVSDEKLYSLSAEVPAEQLANVMVDCANENGGGDNITALIVV
ncbi:MAG: Stp1/IreP family PP2C-type Ser/Thr phosphatase [Oscillospiraceae bacterium]|jgi:protein phosphatase|nr:Stp1/IreP family PP2C-type Ser/Thr phosphatase [Oscillospiraceae bacterium]